MLDPKVLVAAITAAAIAIAEGKSDDDIELLSNVFSQLGDTLATLQSAKQKYENNNDNNN